MNRSAHLFLRFSVSDLGTHVSRNRGSIGWLLIAIALLAAIVVPLVVSYCAATQ